MAKETVLLTVRIDEKSLQRQVQSLTGEIFKLKEANKDLTKAAKEAFEEGRTAQVDRLTKKIAQNNNAIRAAQSELKNLNKQHDLSRQAKDAESGSYEKLLRQHQLASIALKTMEGTMKKNKDGSFQLTEAYKAQAEKVKAAKDALIAFDLGISDGRTNVGNYANSLDGMKQQIADLTAKLGQVEIDSSEFEETQKKIDELTISVQRAEGKIDEFGNREPKNKLKKGYDDLNDSIMGVVGAFQLAQIFGAKDQDTQKRIAVATTALAVSQAAVNVGKGIGATLDTVALARTKAVTAAKALEATVTGLLSGQITVATIATQVWGAAVKVALGPIGLLIAAATAIIGAIVYFTSSVDDAATKTEALRKESELLSDTLSRQQQIIESEIALQKARSDGSIESVKRIQQLENTAADKRLEGLKKQAEIEKQIYKANAEEYNEGMRLKKDASLDQLRYDTDKNKEEMENSKKKYQELKTQIQVFEREEKMLKMKHAQEMIDLTRDEWEQRNQVVEDANKFQIDLLKASGASEGAVVSAQIRAQNDLVAGLYQEKYALIKSGADVNGKEMEEIGKRINDAEQQRTLIQVGYAKTRKDEILKANAELLDSTNRMIQDARAREIAIEETELQRKLAEITGRSSAEIALREQLTEESNAKVQAINKKYDDLDTARAMKAQIEKNNLELAQMKTLNEDKLKLQLENLELEKQQELNATELTLQEKENINEEYRQRELDLRKKFNDAVTAQYFADKSAELNAEIIRLQMTGDATLQKQVELATLERDTILKNENLTASQRLLIEQQYQKAVTDLYMQEIDRRLAANEMQAELVGKMTDTFFSLMQLTADSQSEYAFFQKALAGVQIGIETAKAVANIVSIATAPTPDNIATGGLTIPLKIATNVAVVAAQILKAKQLIYDQDIPEFGLGGAAKVGMFGGKPHSAGGTRGVFDDGTRIEVERDEMFFVINKRSSAMIERLSDINQAGGGVPLIKGAKGLSIDPGITSAASLTGNTDSDIFAMRNQAIMLSSILPSSVVTVEDINAVQGSERLRVQRGDIG